jgi:hypothetical protein
MPLRRLALFGLLLAATTEPLRAEETVTVGGAVVTVPDGWKHAEKDDTVVLTPGDLPQGVGCTFTLLGGGPYLGVLKDRLDAEWKEFQQLGPVTEDDGGKLNGAGNALETASRAGTIEMKPGARIHVWLLLAHTNDRIEQMVFVATTPDAFQKYAPAVAGMFNGIRYVVPKPPEPLEGVCFGFSQVKTDTRAECWIFLPDGVVFRGFPMGGPAQMDLAALRKWDPNSFGEYRAEGEEVVVTMKGEKEPTRFTPSKGAWAAPVTRPFQDRRSSPRGNTIATWTDQVPTTLRISRVQPCNGLKLSGTYRLDATELKYAPKPIPSIRFKADGSFTEDGLVHEVDPGTPKGVRGRNPTAMPAEGGRGKYSIAKNTLELTYQGGSKLTLTFLATDAELAKARPQTIFVHHSKLLLVP